MEGGDPDFFFRNLQSAPTFVPPRVSKCGLMNVSALIRQLQSDELVDRELTPQTAASIRIGLATLSAFAP